MRFFFLSKVMNEVMGNPQSRNDSSNAQTDSVLLRTASNGISVAIAERLCEETSAELTPDDRKFIKMLEIEKGGLEDGNADWFADRNRRMTEMN